MTLISWLLVASLLPISYASLAFFSTPRRKSSRSPDSLPSVLIPSYTSHARLLPTPAKHAFSYPLLYLGVDIDDLHSGSLDLPGRLFTYGGSPWTKILGLRSLNYLTPGPGSLRVKLDKLLVEHGLEKNAVGKAWMVSMPSYLGFEGLNPLSVWFVYSPERALSCVILEVHNTFGEKHTYVLQRNSEYAVEPNKTYDHAWVFPRTFHVSPFSSRNGFYRLDIIDPFPSNIPHSAHPEWKVFLRLLTPDKTPKLTAVVASHPKHRSIPLDQAHVHSIAFALIRWPFTLFLTIPRTLYHAYILQYLKKLAMFPRPEPRRLGHEAGWNPPENYQDQVGRTIGLQELASSEVWLRKVLLPVLERRIEELGIHLSVLFRTKVQPDINLGPTHSDGTSQRLTITTSEPAFFTNLVISPTPAHFLTLAPGLLTDISDLSSFTTLFSAAQTRPLDRIDQTLASIRRRYFSWFLSYSTVICPPGLFVQTDNHFTSLLNLRDRLWLIYVVYMAYFASWAEEGIMHLIRARFVPGSEPWKIWERALRRLYIQADEEAQGEKSELEKEGWEDLGSIQYT